MICCAADDHFCLSLPVRNLLLVIGLVEHAHTHTHTTPTTMSPDCVYLCFTALSIRCFLSRHVTITMSSSTSNHKHRLVIDLCSDEEVEKVKQENKRSRSPSRDAEEKTKRHWHGITKLTPYRTPDQAKLSDTIQFQSILQPCGLKKALLSAMVIDWPWLLAHIPTLVPLTVVTDWDRSRQKAGHHPMPTRMQVLARWSIMGKTSSIHANTT